MNLPLGEGIQRSLRGAAVDTVHNMGPEATLDSTIKKFSIIYGNVKSYDILMGDFYLANQDEEENSHLICYTYRGAVVLCEG